MYCKWASSLEKVFLHKAPPSADYNTADVLQGETFSLQLIYQPDFLLNPLDIKVISPLADHIQIRQVYSMPATVFGEKQDEYILDNRLLDNVELPGACGSNCTGCGRCQSILQQAVRTVSE